jgi:hypothetical protein
VLEDPAGLDELRRLGARSVPVLSRGDDYVFAQNIGHVVKFLGLNEATGPALSPNWSRGLTASWVPQSA